MPCRKVKAGSVRTPTLSTGVQSLSKTKSGTEIKYIMPIRHNYLFEEFCMQPGWATGIDISKVN